MKMPPMPQYQAIAPAISGEEISRVVEGFVFPHLGAKAALSGKTEGNPGDQRSDKGRADAAGDLREGDHAGLLTKPEQQGGEGDHQADPGQQQALMPRAVGDEAGGQGRQQAGDTADGHQQANVLRLPVTLGEKDPQKRAEAVAHVGNKKAGQT